MPRTWPQDWDAQRAGQGCPKCAEGRPAEDQRGIRFFAGPRDFTDEELTGYWTDVRTTAKAIERAYQPCQLNYTTFGDAVPHVHAHITPRYPDDPAPGRPLPDSVFAGATALSKDELTTQIDRLRRHLDAPSNR